MSFRFNPKINDQFLYSLYEDDLVYVEEIFNTTNNQLHSDIGRVAEAYRDQNLSDLKKAVHKIKPSFGFVGLLQAEEICKNFEDKCLTAGSVQELEPLYFELMNTINESKRIIDEECTRLKEHNN